MDRHSLLMECACVTSAGPVGLSVVVRTVKTLSEMLGCRLAVCGAAAACGEEDLKEGEKGRGERDQAAAPQVGVTRHQGSPFSRLSSIYIYYKM